MAAFFPSFRSSAIPKKLLRYVLSRFDIFEEDALDLDNVDLAWGTTTTLEFRDVGIKVRKLEKLLALPPALTFQTAKVLLLRVTLPLDIYTSPIVLEAEGIDVRLKVAAKDGPAGKPSRPAAPGPGAEDAGVVPDAVDLAQSFLETQPTTEKKKLADALVAETQDLGASIALSEDEADEDGSFGTGQALSLPAFLAGFLRGIVDRAQLRIRGVTVQLDVEVSEEVGDAAASDTVTFQLALDKVDIEGVTTSRQDEDGSPRPVSKEGKRHISLDNIRASIVSEANVFAALARSPSMPSSAASQSPTSERRPSFRDFSGLPSDLDESMHDYSADLDPGHDPLQDSEEALNIPYDLSSSSDEYEEEAQEGQPQSSHSTPRASVYQDFPIRNEGPWAHSAVVEHDPPAWSSVSTREAKSMPALLRHEAALSHSVADEPMEESFHSSSSNDEGALASPEDLTRSQVFSHEEAESMYMSAFSQAGSRRMGSAMPGAWDAEDSSPEASPKAQRVAGPTRQTSGAATSEIPAEAAQEEAEALLEQTPRNASPEIAPSSPRRESAQAQPSEEPMPAPQDDVPTPRGPTRLVKELISLQTVSIYVASNHKHLQVAAADGQSRVLGASTADADAGLGRSVAPQVPGAFSVYAGAASVHQPAAAGQPIVFEQSEHATDGSLEIVLAPVDIRFDASVGFLLARVVSKLLELLKGPAKLAAQEAGPTNTKASSPLAEIKVTVEQISLLFLEKMAGVADTPVRISDPKPFDYDPDVLLKAGLQNLNVVMSMTDSTTTTSVDLEKFRFGYADADMIAFDRQLQMRASVRDAFPTAGADVSVKVTQSSDSTKCEITTLPLHVAIDLQRLDETFSWFGGLSSFLSMGSSMTSTRSWPAQAHAPLPKPRGVRFDTPIKPDDKSATSENKMDMRIGGFHLDLVGRDCNVALDTSAVKLVSREEGVGVGLSKIRLSGPYLRNSRREPPINAEILNTRLEYLMAPKDQDLERLLELITPSKVKFDDGDDEIMVDTLLRQRKKGAVLRLGFDHVSVSVGEIQQLTFLPGLGEEMARLATVAKYLPEDDRPGLLTLGLIHNLDLSVDVGGRFGTVQTTLKGFEVAHITIPSLVAVSVGSIAVNRNKIEELVGSSSLSPAGLSPQVPALMMRLIGDDIEPVIKIKMQRLDIEYRVPTVMDILGLAEDATPQDFEAGLAASVANLGDHAHAVLVGSRAQPKPMGVQPGGKASKPVTVDLAFRDCVLGLNPLGLPSKLGIVLTDAHLEIVLPKDENVKAVGYLNKAAILLVDDVSNLSTEGAQPEGGRRISGTMVRRPADMVADLCAQGYVDICQISSARATVRVTEDDVGDKHVDVELRDDLLVLETCADSTQTLIALANALKPPTPPSKEVRFKTEVIPMQDLLASISADAFGRAEGDYDFDNDFALAQELGGSQDTLEEGSSPLEIDSDYYGSQPEGVGEELLDATSSSMVSDRTTTQDTGDGVLLTNFDSSADVVGDDGDDLVINENYFGAGSVLGGTAHEWNSAKNTYDTANDARVQASPLTVRVRDVHIIWNLFDGYDWQHTRDVITRTVEEVETKAHERRSRSDRRTQFEQDFEEEETVIGDFLFNSIYIGIPATHDPRELTQAINQNLRCDNETETESIATTTATATASRVAGGGRRPRPKRLRLNRSRHHKITFELKGVSADLVTFPPGSGETESSVDVRVRDLDIFDHIPDSTWKKFATYDKDAGEREMGTSMVHLELLSVRPVPELAASEMVLKVTVLPLRLHVDQDALDFITRFFEFKDDAAPMHGSPSDVPFIQRAEVCSIPVTLDFKPKRVDYAGLRSGHTTEFMNFLILDTSRMVLRHTIIYGVSGFDRLGKTLNDIWMPDVKRTQLPGVLAGLAPVRSLVNVGSGFRDLVEIPIREYRRDGRIVRSLGRGAAAFARTTGTEIVKLGAKVAVGTQYVLQGAEGMLVRNPQGDAAGGPSSSSSSSAAAAAAAAAAMASGGGGAGGDGDGDPDAAQERRKQISLYADQPTGVIQGLRHAYSSLARDLNVARDAIIAVPGEVMESQSAQGAARAVLRRAPTIVFRPAIGATRAIGQTLMGATNSLDPQNIRRAEDKYKSGPGR